MGIFQSLELKTIDEDTVPSVKLLLVKFNVTSAVGWLFRLTVKAALSPPSPVFKLLAPAIVNPGLSSSIIIVVAGVTLATIAVKPAGVLAGVREIWISLFSSSKKSPSTFRVTVA